MAKNIAVLSNMEERVLRAASLGDWSQLLPGAAVNAAAEALTKSGYLDPSGRPTTKGWAWLEAHDG